MILLTDIFYFLPYVDKTKLQIKYAQYPVHVESLATIVFSCEWFE